jgi:hypothetical protein
MTRHQFVDHLPDLIQPDEYAADPQGRRVKIRLAITDRGVEILGDAVRPDEIERLLLGLDPEILEQMLCG